MECLNDLLKTILMVFCILFFITGFSFFLTQIERSDILELRYCPHCGEQLINRSL